MGNNINVLRIENLVTTASFNPFTSSFNAFSSSINSYTASQNILNGTYTTTSSFQGFTSSINATVLDLQNATASLYAASASINAYTASQNILNGKYATTGSNTFEGVQTINSNLIVTGSITAQTLVVQTITSSVDFVTGSTHFGTISSNTHEFTGSVSVSGSLAVNGSNVILTNQTASMSVATASYWSGSILNATSASFASTASYWSGSINNVLSASFADNANNAQTASYVQNAQSASYWSGSIINAATASFVTLAQSASYWSGSITNALSASYAATASYWSGSIFNAVSASFAELARSASFATTASFALNAGSGGGGGLSALYIQDEGITQGTASYIDFVGNGVTATVSNGTASINIPGGAGASQAGGNSVLTQSVSNVTWSFTHNLGTQYPVFTIFDSNDDVIIPQRINAVNTSSALIYFSTPRAGYAVASQGGNVTTASYALVAVSASYASNAQNATTASYVTLAQTASFVLNAQTASFVTTAQTASFVANAQTASFANNFTVAGTLTAQTLVVQTITSSVIYSSGSNVFGNDLSNTQQLTGSVSITGSLAVNGSNVILSNQTSSMSVATASFASTASYWSGSINNVASASFASTASYWSGSIINAETASFVQTASFALNGGVTQILAGANVTIAPTNGKGQVTISATGGGGSNFNTATGSYGSFYDTTTQTNPVANVPRSMSFNTTAITNGVSISGSTNPFNTYIKTENPGVYNIQFSAQLDKTDSGIDEIVIWLAKNGTALTDTATTISLNGNNDKQVAAWNWFVNSAANDYYQIIWYSADTDLRILAEVAGGGHPGIPSVIATVNRVDQFLSNTGSFSGSFNGQFTGSLLGTATTASFVQTAQTASFVTLAQTASFVITAQTASFVTTAQTASFVQNAVSSSYALTASFALNGGGGGISAISIADEGILLGSASYFDFTGAGVTAAVSAGTASFTIPGGGGGNSGLSTFFTQSIAAVTWSFTHNLNTRTPLVQVYDSGYQQITPQYVSASNGSTVEIGFGIATSGFAVASTGGTLYVTGSNVIFDQPTAAATWSFSHNLNTQYPVFQVFDSNNEVIVPQVIKAVDSASVLIYFPVPVAGKAVASLGGLSGSINANSASFATTASYVTLAQTASFVQTAQTASFVVTAQTASFVQNAVSSSFAATASFALNSGGSGVGFPFSGSAVITGSFLVSQSFVDFTQASYVTGSFTGSLLGTASYATTASYAMFALTASTAPGYTVQFTQSVAAATWSFNHNMNTRNPIVQVYDSLYRQIVPNDIIGVSVNTAEIRFNYNESGYVVMSNGGGLYVTGSTSQLTQTSAAVTWSFTHNLNSKYINFETYDSGDNVIIPAGIHVIDTNNAELYFATATSGIAIAQFSGINGAPNSTTASYALTATSASYAVNATTASYALTATSASYALTATSASFASTASYLNPIQSSYVILSQVSASLNYADDTAAAAGGVPLGGLYRNGNFILIRIS
jgi:hypothetical protein